MHVHKVHRCASMQVHSFAASCILVQNAPASYNVYVYDNVNGYEYVNENDYVNFYDYVDEV